MKKKIFQNLVKRVFDQPSHQQAKGTRKEKGGQWVKLFMEVSKFEKLHCSSLSFLHNHISIVLGGSLSSWS